MKDSYPSKPSQSRPVENARLAYVQIPITLLTLPTGERAAAIEVWAALHYHLRLGSSPQRITDEELARSPFLKGRSRQHRVNGLETLERSGLIRRTARGSSRQLAIACTLKSVRQSPSISIRSSVNLRQCPSDLPVDVTPELDELNRRWFPRRCANPGLHIAPTNPRACAGTPGD